MLRPTQLYGDLIAGALRPEALRDGAHYWRALRPAVADRGSRGHTDCGWPSPTGPCCWPSWRRLSTSTSRDSPCSPTALWWPRRRGWPGSRPAPSRVWPVSSDGSARWARPTSASRSASSGVRSTAAPPADPTAAVGPRPTPAPTRRTGRARSHGSTLIAPATAVRLAKAIATRIHDLAIRGADGTVTWIVPAFEHDGRYLLRPMGLDLYGGTAGVGLFLAALSRVTGDAAHRALALAAVGGLAQLADQTAASAFPVGGLTGLGSAIYTLVCVADLLDRPDLLDTAAAIARHARPGRRGPGHGVRPHQWQRRSGAGAARPRPGDRSRGGAARRAALCRPPRVGRDRYAGRLGGTPRPPDRLRPRRGGHRPCPEPSGSGDR